MRSGIVMGTVMLSMGHAGRSHEPVRQNETDQQRPHETGSFHTSHRIRIFMLFMKCRGFHRLLFLNARHRIENLLFGQESALDIFLDNALFIDEHAHR